jgi:hypothetical protein
MTYALDPIDDSFFDTAPIVVPATVELDAPPQRVWDALGSGEMWSWAPIIDRLQWLPPLNGTPVRRLRLFGLATIEEEFYRWEEPRRATFRVRESTRPLLRGLAEDFVLEELPGGRTRLTWTMALAPKGSVPPALGRALSRLLASGNTLAIGGLRKIL